MAGRCAPSWPLRPSMSTGPSRSVALYPPSFRARCFLVLALSLFPARRVFTVCLHAHFQMCTPPLVIGFGTETRARPSSRGWGKPSHTTNISHYTINVHLLYISLAGRDARAAQTQKTNRGRRGHADGQHQGVRLAAVEAAGTSMIFHANLGLSL